MAELITATQARTKIEDRDTETGREALERLIAAVNKEVERGGSTAWIYGNHRLLNLAKEIAEEKGYTATINLCQRDGDSLKVEW